MIRWRRKLFTISLENVFFKNKLIWQPRALLLRPVSRLTSLESRKQQHRESRLVNLPTECFLLSSDSLEKCVNMYFRAGGICIKTSLSAIVTQQHCSRHGGTFPFECVTCFGTLKIGALDPDEGFKKNRLSHDGNSVDRRYCCCAVNNWAVSFIFPLVPTSYLTTFEDGFILFSSRLPRTCFTSNKLFW